MTNLMLSVSKHTSTFTPIIDKENPKTLNKNYDDGNKIELTYIQKRDIYR